MSNLLYEQVYMKDDVIQEAYDPKCDHLYFVLQGKLKVEAQVTVE